MTDNEIIKALECCISNKCTCSECSYEYTKHIKNEEFEVMSNGKSYDEWSCDEWLKCDLLDLINRQKAEIERLTINMNAFGLGMKREKERADNARAEAVKEFAERLKEECGNVARMEFGGFTYFCVGFEFFDNLVKEFTEGESHEMA